MPVPVSYNDEYIEQLHRFRSLLSALEANIRIARGLANNQQLDEAIDSISQVMNRIRLILGETTNFIAQEHERYYQRDQRFSPYRGPRI